MWWERVGHEERGAVVEGDSGGVIEAVLPVASSGELGVEEFTLGGVDTGWGMGGWWGWVGGVAAFPEVRGVAVLGL